MMFDHEKLFGIALQMNEPLYVKQVEFNAEEGELHIYIDFRKGSRFKCPVCDRENLEVHDTHEKTWRHLNFFQYKAYLHFRTPRTICPEHNIRLINVPWSAGSGFTLLFEALIMQLSTCMPVSAIAKLVDENDTLLWRVIERYIEEAKQKADYSKIKSVGVDETASKRGHNYVTIFVDMDKAQVVHVTEGKDASTIESFKEMLNEKEINPKQISNYSADMSPAFRKGIEENFPWANLTYDKFHVIKLMNEALDAVRRGESKEQEALLKKTRYIWLYNPENLNESQSAKLAELKNMNLKTTRAYRIKLSLQDIYNNANDRDKAEIMLKFWYSWAIRSRLDPVRKFAKTVKEHWDGILNYFDSKLTNGILEGINSLVQTAKNRARGYRNTKNFISMIFLIAGKLNLNLAK